MIRASVVVVPTYNRRSSLQRCLDALLSQRFARDEYEIIVVSEHDMQQPGPSDVPIHFLRQSNHGAADAMNRGLQVANGEIVIFIDDECICESDFVNAHVQAHGDAEDRVVLGPLPLHPECPRTAANELLREREQRRILRITSEGLSLSDLVIGANSSVRPPLLQKCALDAAYLHGAGIELGIRMRAAGAEGCYASTAAAYRICNKTPDDLVADAANLSRCEVELARQYPAYRAVSSIAGWNRNVAKERAVRSLTARLPFSPEPVLKLLFTMIHPFQKRAFMLRAAHWLLKLRVGIASCRAAVSASGSWTGLRALFLLRVPILLYHHIMLDTDPSPSAMSMAQSTFERQMQWLSASGYRGISVSEFIAWRENNSQLPPKPVLITFDDAYDDTAQYAFPILLRGNGPYEICDVLPASMVGSSLPALPRASGETQEPPRQSWPGPHP